MNLVEKPSRSGELATDQFNNSLVEDTRIFKLNCLAEEETEKELSTVLQLAFV